MQGLRNSRRGIGGRPKKPPTAVVRLPVPLVALARRLAQGDLRAGDINEFLDVQPGKRLAVPFAGAEAKCGFPSPAEDYTPTLRGPEEAPCESVLPRL
jgi:DNA polymerase V